MGKRGFIAMISFILLLILGIMGVGYWSVSRLSTDMIVKEAHRIKARNLAQAGVEKVMVNIMNQYRLGSFDMEYPGSNKFVRERLDKEYEMDFGDGRYKVELVEPYVLPGSNSGIRNQQYYKNKVSIGVYDVWRIVVVGEIPQSRTLARVETLVKVIRNTVQY